MNFSREFLRKIVQDQYELILSKSFGIEREILSKLDEKLRSDHIIVITGIRRSGKSTLLRQIIRKNYSDRDFYYLNFDDERLAGFTVDDFDRIHEVLIEQFGDFKVFFFDEIQNVPEFERFIRRLHEQGKKVIITGSNASLLSSEISTRLTGRHLDIELFPFSFREFLSFYNLQFKSSDIYSTKGRTELIKKFDQYSKFGGMPEFLKFNEPEILMGVYNDILIKDITIRNRITNALPLKELSRYLFSNVGNLTNYSKLSHMVNIKSPNTIKAYLEYIQTAYLGFLVSKLEFSYKKQILADRKFYAIDTGLIEKITTKLTEDKGWMLENIVYIELRRRYKQDQIFYIKSEQEDCDFAIVDLHSVQMIIQITYFLSDENREREITNISSAMQKYNLTNGFILTYDQEEEVTFGLRTIHIKPVWKWLLHD